MGATGVSGRRKRLSVKLEIDRLAYPRLLASLTVKYMRSRSFRSIVHLYFRHRRFIGNRTVRLALKYYLIATTARVTVSFGQSRKET